MILTDFLSKNKGWIVKGQSAAVDFNSMQELHDYYEKKMREIRHEVKGIFLKCDSCKNNKYGICSGGCLAHILNNFNQEGEIR